MSTESSFTPETGPSGAARGPSGAARGPSGAAKRPSARKSHPAVRFLLRWGGRLAYVGLLGVLFVLAGYFAFSFFVRSGVTAAPQLGGVSEAEARELLANRGLDLQVLEAGEFDPEIPAGHIVRQDPPARTLVKRGGDVRVLLSLGPQVLRVPDLSGQTALAAQIELSAAGLVPGRTVSVRQDALAGTVVGQSPAEDAAVAPGTVVDLLVCSADQSGTFVMPDLIYRDYETVRRFFSQRGFRLGRVKYDTYPGIREGVILQQFPRAGNPLRRQDAISLEVVRNQLSRGVEEAESPESAAAVSTLPEAPTTPTSPGGDT